MVGYSIKTRITISLRLGKPRGFGFVVMADAEGVQKVLDASPHFLEGKLVSDKLN